MAAHHGRDQWQKLTLAAEKDGTVTGLKVELLADLGAYVALVGGGVPVLGAFMFNAIYKFPAYHFDLPDGAHQQDLDRRLPRRRPARGDVRHRAADGRARRRGRRRPAGDPREELDQARGVPVHHRGRPGVRLRQLRGRHREGQGDASGTTSCAPSRSSAATSGDPVQLGIGVSTFTEMCGLAPSPGARQRSTTAPAAGSTRACGCCPPARSRSSPGASAHGQGHETAFSQIVADRLGVPFEDVEVLHGDTQVAHKGLDTYGSRSLVVGGEALVQAADKVIEKAKPIAAHLLEASVDDLEFTGGRFGVRGTDQGMAIGEIAHRGLRGAQPARRRGAVARRRRDVRPGQLQLSRTARTCARWRSTPRPAQVKMRKYVCVDDIGNIINPLIVAGQVHGGLVQGIAQALWEEAVYDDAGTLVSGSFVDYLVPTAADTISFDIDHTTTAVDDQHARHQGRRRGRHDRLDPGRGQRGRRRGPPLRRQRHPDAVHARAGLEGDPRRRRRRRRPDRREARRRTSTRPPATRARPTARKEQASDPRHSSTTSRRPSVEEALAALAEHGDDAKVIAGGQSLLPVLRMRLNAPEVVDRPRQDRLAARHPRRRRRDRDRRDDARTTTCSTDPLVARARAAAAPRRSRTVADAADPAPRHLRRRARARRPGR